MRTLLGPVVGCLSLCVSVSTYAHHSYAAYATDSPIEITGVVSNVRFTNPHASYRVDVTDDAGDVTSWTVETSAPAVLRRRGWDHTTISVGDVVTVSGAPMISGKPEMNLDYFVMADGSVLTRNESTEVLGRATSAPAAAGMGMGMGMGGGPREFLPEPAPSGASRDMLEGIWVTNVQSPYVNPRDPRGRQIMTEEGLARFDSFDVDLDNMGNCRLVGAPRMARGTIYSQEFVDGGDIIYIISEYNAQARRIYMEGQQPHKYFAPNLLGWSNGEFEDGVLTITTRHLTEERIDGSYIFGGGEDAYVVEKIYLTEGGDEMIYYAWFHDPVHYTEPFRTSQSWVRIDDVESGFVLDCIPVFYNPEEE